MACKVMTLGGGAREHAIAEALVRSGAKHYSIMSNNNPGIARLSKCVKHIKENNVTEVADAACQFGVELAVIGPEAPLGYGVVDELENGGILCASPNRAASMLEISKSFARDLMAKHEIPGRVAYRTFDSLDGLDDFLKKMNGEVAVKPVGLTGGKGVKISGEHLKDDDEIRSYCKEILEKSIGGSGFVIEEKLVGEEFTLQAFSDGENVYPLPAVQDHKRAYEGDTGPNTGGMGSYSQADHLLPFLTNEEYLRSVDIVKSTVEAMRKEGCPYKGVIYGQFMLTRSGPKVVEFNARFGDPEAMNVLPLLDGNYVEICTGIARGKVPANEVKFKDLATVCKYVVPKGYGVKSIANEPLHVDEEAISKTGAKIYYAAVDKRDDGLYTTTSRSLGVVGMANTIEEAERRAEMALEYVKGTIFMRHDIGKRASIERKVAHMERVRRG